MRRPLLYMVTLVAVLVAALGAPASLAATDIHTWPLQSMIQTDMSAGHQQIPHGVPTYFDWYSRPVVHDANDKNGYGFANPWGQVYDAATGDPIPWARIEVRDMQMWTLSKSTNQWTALYSSPPPVGGALYPENFQGSPTCALLDTTTRPGSTLASPNIDCHNNTLTGRLYHFFPSVARAVISNPLDVAAVAVQARIRLATENAPSPYYAGYIANVGADFWQCAACGTVSGSGESRFKTVDRTWNTLVYSTADPVTQPLPPVAVDPSELR